ncbi:ParB/RepB/Spo0J family partition protein [Salibacterium salarium]|uniref:ParB/RepB/Spo0J family partition protein n=1 Tax=Salibacterium salarium TaxID=284579 RepID=UPI00163B3369|nr:ParB/RepB/Spo0J family partition protein [Salibacterium salarium]
MSGKIAIKKLNPHPKNTHYFTDVDGEKYEEMKRSIETHGIRDALKVTTAYTVVSGHQRLRIAKEIGLEAIPVEILDVDEWEAEYLLIAENVERRGQAETDSMKKSRIAKFLQEYWGVQHGGERASGQNGHLKTTADIAESIGESEKSTRRILKLNDLIPEIQTLVSDKKIGTTAAEQLAYLTQDEQRALLDAKGDISGTSVQDAKGYRSQAKEAEESGEDFAEKIRELEQKITDAEKRADKAETERDEIAQKEPEVQVERVEVMPKKKAEELQSIQQERDELEASLSRTYSRLQDLEKAKRSQSQVDQSPLFDILRTTSVLNGYLKSIAENPRYADDLAGYANDETLSKSIAELSNLESLARQTSSLLKREETVILEN